MVRLRRTGLAQMRRRVRRRPPVRQRRRHAGGFRLVGAPLPDNPRSLWLRVSRTGPDVEVRYAVDGQHYDLLRLSRLTDARPLLVGPMCAAPDGAGFEVTFAGFTVGPPGE